MSLTAASTFARRVRNARSAPPGALVSLQSSVVARYHRAQTRSFRFGRIWPSYQDPEVHRDLYRRRQELGYKCCQNLNRRLSWYKPTFAEDVKSTLKRVVHHNWHPYRWVSRSAGRYMNTVASPRKTPDNPEGVRPGYSIEDAERAPLEHLLFGGKGGQRATSQARPSATKDRAVAASSSKPDDDYVIDPITNRKVSRKSLDSPYSTSDHGVEIPVGTFKSYQSQFAPFRAPEVRDSQIPIFSDGPPPEAELRMYGQDKVWDSDNRSSRSRPSAKSQSEQPLVSHYGAPPSSLLDTLRWEHKEVRWHQNGSIASTSAAPVNGPLTHDPDATEYLDLHRYTAVRYHEPDGKPLEEQPSSKPEDLDKYDAVRSHEPDGKYKVESESYITSQELGMYGAFRSHEPGGKYSADYTDPPDEAELAEYSKPFRSHEPDGKYATSYIEPGCDPAELAKYRDPFFCYEPDGKYAASYFEPKPDEAELSQYKAFRSHEPDGKYAAANHTEQKPVSSELATYGPFRSHEPDGKYAAKHAKKPDSDELATYGPFCSHEPDGKYAASSTTSPAEPADTEEYQAFRSHEPDGKYAAASRSAEEAQDLGNHEAFSYEDVETRPPFQGHQESTEHHDLKGYRTVQPEESHGSGVTSLGNGCDDPAELGKYQAVRWNEPDGKPAEAETSGQSLFEYDLKDEAPVIDPVSSSYGRDSLHEKPPHLTGNYVRDFPEEFATTWNVETATETVSSASETPEPVQPALERCNEQKTGAETRNAAAKPSAKLTSPTEPTLYKVLVYDPTMQCIETAETTSVALDSAAPLTPAEVLLRISNPAKFFPHFAPLQDQGFEIVSGSGDVLIFRKIREAVPEAQQAEHASKATAAPATINPIDMTGGRRDYTVAAGRFASPTGFVNYELPAESAARSERDTSRGETAASEKKAEGGRVGKRSLPKRVVMGTAWLAGISYSIGVVSEYFNTGGSDGKGPKGL